MVEKTIMKNKTIYYFDPKSILPMGTIIAVLSMSMNSFGFLGSLATRNLYF